MELLDKVAVITGAGSGIGRATSLRLAKEKAKIIVADFCEESGRRTMHEIISEGGKAQFVNVDVSKEDEVREMFVMAESIYGGVDIIHNNAGVLGGPRFPDANIKYWNRAIDINIKGVLYGIFHGLPFLKKRGGGVIVNTASTAGLTPSLLDPVYGATKAAVVNLTRSLTFLHNEAGVRVNCVCPALVRTSLEKNSSRSFDSSSLKEFLTGRAGRSEAQALVPDDVARAVQHLIEDDEINGVSYKIVVDQPWDLIAPLEPQKVG